MKPNPDDWIGHLDISRFLQWRFNTYLMRMLPIFLMHVYVSFLGKIYYHFNQREYLRIRRIICYLLEKREGDLNDHRTVKEAFAGIFMHYTEKLFTGYANLKRTLKFFRQNVAIEGSPLLEEALSQGRGVILVTGHYGAVEFLPTVLGLQGYAVTMLLRFKKKKLKKSLQQRIKKAGDMQIELVDVDKSKNVMFEALRALKKNRIVITECDEFEQWRPCKYRLNDFLGQMVAFDRTLDLLHRRSKSPVVMGIIQRHPSYQYTLRFHDVRVGKDKKDAPISQQALRILEKYILEEPTQWYQWKEAEYIVNANIIEEPKTIRAVEEDQYLPLEDTPVHAF